MSLRSLLFVPADSDKKLARAASCDADALVIDLEDSVLPERKPIARGMMQDYLNAAADRSKLWVRVNDLASGELLNDLAAVVPARPAGIVLPKTRGPEDFQTVSHYLEALEVANGVEVGSIAITGVITETPAAVLRMGELVRQPCSRLKAVAWGGEDLSSALGAGDPRTSDGAWRPTYEYARIQCLLAAHALQVAAIDTVYVNFQDPEGLRRACEAARYDGFTGRIAIHPDQVPIINAAFTPTEAELAMARRIVAAFESGAGAVSLDGKMYDIPHLKAARRLLGS
jgi:citrate lyase subunit beta / citryl-CoA lyase